MKCEKITDLLGDGDFDKVPRFITKNWVEVYYQSGGTYNPNKQIRFKTPQLRSDLCDYNDAYILVTGKIGVTNPDDVAYDTKLALKNNEPFFNCVTKNNDQLIDDANDLDVVIPMHDLLSFSKNYRKITGYFWHYYIDEPNSGYNNNNRDRTHYSIKDSNSFDYKASITGKLEANEDELEDVKIIVPLKNISNFFRSLNFSVINSEIFVELKWSKNCVLTSKTTRNALPADAVNNLLAAAAINNPTNVEFLITDCKLYVPVVTLSAENENKLFEQLKTGFERTIKWNNNRSEISNQTANNNLNYSFEKEEKIIFNFSQNSVTIV